MHFSKLSRRRFSTAFLQGLVISGVLAFTNNAGQVNAQIPSATAVKFDPPGYRLACGELYTPAPFVRGFLKWSSQTAGPKPPVPTVSMIARLTKIIPDRPTGLEIGYAYDQRSAFVGQFQVMAKANYSIPGQFNGTILYNSTGVTTLPKQRSDIVVCR
jgi:hypothetical protein